jgi:transposase
MIQDLVLRRFGVFYSARYISQLLGNMGFSYQKAKLVADGKDPEKRKEWLEKTWPEIMQVAKEKNAMVLFGDEASFPQWGSLTYTWALRGEQPVVETSGTRRGYKVFGLIDYYTGRFFCKGHDQGRLSSESYQAFIKGVLSQTRKHIILIQDGARYHTSRAMRDFFERRSLRLTVYQLPSYSPDYNPIEKLWKKIKEKDIHLHHFPTFESLKTKVQAALVRFQDMQSDILRLFGFYTKMESSA